MPRYAGMRASGSPGRETLALKIGALREDEIDEAVKLWTLAGLVRAGCRLLPRDRL